MMNEFPHHSHLIYICVLRFVALFHLMMNVLILSVKQVTLLNLILMQTWLLFANMHLQLLTQQRLWKHNYLVQIAKPWKVFQLLMQSLSGHVHTLMRHGCC